MCIQIITWIHFNYFTFLQVVEEVFLHRRLDAFSFKYNKKIIYLISNQGPKKQSHSEDQRSAWANQDMIN